MEVGTEDPVATSRDEPPPSGSGAEASPHSGTPSLEEQLETLRAEAAADRDRFLRARAELENIQKRQKRELADRVRYGAEYLARDLLECVDNLERAASHDAAGDSASLFEGVELVRKSLMAALERHGVARIDAAGQAFDPAVHEAVAMVPAQGTPDGTVVEDHRAGYRLHDRLLRPSMVVVAKNPADTVQAAQPGQVPQAAQDGTDDDPNSTKTE